MFDLPKAKEIFETAFGCDHSHEYAGLEIQNINIDGTDCDLILITKDQAASIADEIKHSVYNEKTLPKILFDMNVLYRMYQEITIDSAKTGEEVNIDISLRKYAWAKSLAHVKAHINKNNRVSYSKNVPDTKKDIMFTDTISVLKREFFDDLKELFDNVLLSKVVEYTNDDMAKFERYSLVQYRDLVNSIMKLKFYYNDITGGHRVRLDAIHIDDEDAKKEESTPKTESSICSKCGKEMPKGNKFCPHCGEKAVSARECPSCHVSITNNAKFCPNCGANISERRCIKCGAVIKANVKFCPECGTKND
jgi:RNA polymerase subunit RPABC4/transcription elongation factor Spt4